MITRRKLQIFIIVLLLVLNIAIYLNGRQLSPDNCVITFKSERASGLMNRNANFDITAKLTDLYGGFKDGRCPVRWDGDRGYFQD